MKIKRGFALLPITAAILVAAPSTATAYYADGGKSYTGWEYDYHGSESLVNVVKAWNGTDGTFKKKISLDFNYSDSPRPRLINNVSASSRCVGCGAVAVGFQVAVLTHPAPKVYAENKAFSYNDKCFMCQTVALAYQFIVITPKPLILSPRIGKELDYVAASLNRLNTVDLAAPAVDAYVAAHAEKVQELLSQGAKETGNPANVEVKRFADLTPR